MVPTSTLDSGARWMRLRRTIHFKLPKTETLTNVFSRLVEMLGHHGCTKPIIVFRLENMPGGRSNACARVTKTFPKMGCFQQTEIDKVFPKESVLVLTNRPSASNGISVVPIQLAEIETLEQIANGVPKSYPFFWAEFLFAGVSFLDCETKTTAQSVADFLSVTGDSLACADIPNVYLKNGYTPSGRRCELKVTIEQPMPAFDLKSIPDFGKASDFIASLGKVGLTHTSLVLSEEEDKKIDSLYDQSQKFYAEYESTVANHINRISFPHDLPAPSWEMAMSGFEKVGSLKEPLVEVFRAMGYRYEPKQSGRGEYCLQKRTPRGNLIKLSLDTGFMTKSVSAGLYLSGLGLRYNFSLLPISAKLTSISQYPILDLEHWRKIVENLGAVVDYLESQIIPGIDEIWGQCPLWYSTWT